MALSPDGKRLYVVCSGSDEVLVVDTASRAVSGRVAVGKVPCGIAVAPDGKRFYVTNSWSDTVSEVDAASLQVLRTLPAGFEPTGVAIAPDKSRVYVSASGSNEIVIVDLAKLAAAARQPNAARPANDLSASARYVVARVAVGRNPRNIRLSPDGAALYVANRVDDTVTIVDTARALEDAAAADRELAADCPRGPLHGVPFSIKDSLEQAGAIPIARTNLPDLLFAFESANLIFGVTKTCGGSSGGEAALITACDSPLGLGSDDAGSVRLPRTGHFPPAGGWLESVWQIGPMARRVEDVIAAMRLLTGLDGIDPTVPDVPYRDPQEVKLADLRIAVFTDNGFAAADAEVSAVVRAAAYDLEMKLIGPDGGAMARGHRPARGVAAGRGIRRMAGGRRFVRPGATAARSREAPGHPCPSLHD